MVNCPLFTNIIMYDLMDNNIVKLHFFAPFTVSANPYTDTLIINLTRRLSFRIKTTKRFLSISSRG